MAEVPAWLTRDVGPLPVWGWAAAGAVGVGLGVAWRRRSQSSTARPRTSSSDPAELIYTPALGGVTGSGAGGVLPGTATTPVESNNNDWRRRALAIAIEQGYSATTADTILSLYFDGEPLSADQQKLLDVVIPMLGLPPDPPSIRPAPAPAAPTTQAPADDPGLTDSVGSTIAAGYREVLGRDPDQGGLAYWRTVLGGGGVDEQGFRVQLANSAEARQRIVADAYREVLRREPDPAGLDYWVGEIASGRATVETVKSSLRNSTEYRQRIAGQP